MKCQHVLKGSKPISDMENKKKKKEKKMLASFVHYVFFFVHEILVALT